MRRRQLVELEDLAWFPAALRDAATDYLRCMLNLGDNYAPAVPVLAEALRRTSATRIVDLCAGGGGPWQRLQTALAEAGQMPTIVLTDRYPNAGAAAFLRAANAPLSYHAAAVDAQAVPPALIGFRTMFTAFHHFTPNAAHAVLRGAVQSGAPIGIFENTQRSLRSIALIAFSPLFVFVVMPFVRPFHWRNLFFTYLVPVLPLMVLWDGIVSCLRSYTVDELRELGAAASVGAAYEWQAGEAWGKGPLPVTYLIGLPR